jgi:hypothetical protein
MLTNVLQKDASGGLERMSLRSSRGGALLSVDGLPSVSAREGRETHSVIPLRPQNQCGVDRHGPSRARVRHQLNRRLAMIGLEKKLSIAFTVDPEFCPTRRWLALAPLFAALPLALSGSTASAAKIDPSETVITPPDAIKWTSWNGLPPHIGETATLYGGLDQPGPYLVLMKWHPGYFSAPHFYATDRLSLVLSGTWWVNSGTDFDPDNTVPVPAGGFVRRVAHTPHYDGVKKSTAEPAVIALFGLAPVDLTLVDPSKPAWRQT